MATWELTTKLGPFLDRHLVIPLMEFLTVKGIYDETDLLRGKLELLSNTNMVDYTMEVHKNLYPDQELPQKLTEKRQKVVEDFKQLQAATDPILKIFADPEVTRQIQNSRDSKQLLEYLSKNHNFKEEMTDTCYDFAKCLFECGNYAGKNDNHKNHYD
jgi:translation initiation factor 3 subunit E